LDGREGNKHPVIAPQMPACRLIGQPVLNNQAHRQGDDPMRVMRFGPRIVGHIRVKGFPALATAVLRILNIDIAGPPIHQITHIM
jgi:hypothetical protein